MSKFDNVEHLRSDHHPGISKFGLTVETLAFAPWYV